MIKLLFFFISFIILSCSIMTPERPKTVHENANWIGGVDGGVWIYTKEKIDVGKYIIEVYNDIGNLWVQDTFKIDNKCHYQIVNTTDIDHLISGFDGTNIYLKIKEDNQYCKLVPQKEMN